jgi:hypothetical protein
MLSSLLSRMRKVAAVSTRLYFFMKFFVDLENHETDVYSLKGQWSEILISTYLEVVLHYEVLPAQS